MHAVRYRWLKDLRLKVFSPSENTGVMYKAGPVPTSCAAIAGDASIVPKASINGEKGGLCRIDHQLPHKGIVGGPGLPNVIFFMFSMMLARAKRPAMPVVRKNIEKLRRNLIH